MLVGRIKSKLDFSQDGENKTANIEYLEEKEREREN